MKLETLNNYTSSQFKDYVYSNGPDVFEVFDTINADIVSIDNRALYNFPYETPVYVIGEDPDNKVPSYYNCTVFFAPDEFCEEGGAMIFEQGTGLLSVLLEKDALLNIINRSMK